MKISGLSNEELLDLQISVGRNLTYKEYQKTDHWRDARLTKLESTGFLCERCSQPATQVHHKHYSTLWHERLGDLESICGNCHVCAHREARNANNHIRSIS